MNRYSFFIYLGDDENNPKKTLLTCCFDCDNEQSINGLAKAINDAWCNSMPIMTPIGKVSMSNTRKIQ